VRKVLRSGETSFEHERAVQPRPKLGRWAAELDGLLAGNAAKACYGARGGRLIRRRRGKSIELGLQLRSKTPKWRVWAKLRDDRKDATQPNETWAMDLFTSQLDTGNKIRVLTVVDLFSRYVPVLDSRFSYRAENVVQTLQQICARTGYPKTIRVD
jgi:putative transposase